ncbi:MAG: hypothetical protein HC902_11655 [Calothrix sp. SM1_5_4]|nr:hypothetical protein [Calothrix sp. SM1_5_4]
MEFIRETVVYVGRIREFDRRDWLVYVAWIGLMSGLFFSVSGFFLLGVSRGVQFPSYAWNIPIGTFIFVAAIALDTVGHRTIYKEALKEGEALIHHITIFAGITSVVGLCLAYENPGFMYFPVMVMIFLSIIYSLIDEGMHWRRYLTQKSDRVEMWSHFFILTGHLLMITSWWYWYTQGYPGVAETLARG